MDIVHSVNTQTKKKPAKKQEQKAKSSRNLQGRHIRTESFITLVRFDGVTWEILVCSCSNVPGDPRCILPSSFPQTFFVKAAVTRVISSRSTLALADELLHKQGSWDPKSILEPA